MKTYKIIEINILKNELTLLCLENEKIYYYKPDLDAYIWPVGYVFAMPDTINVS